MDKENGSQAQSIHPHLNLVHRVIHLGIKSR